MAIAAGQTIHQRYQLSLGLGKTATGRQRNLETQESAVFNPEIKWEQVKLFEREAKVLQALSHPGILKYRDYSSLYEPADGVSWLILVQQYILGAVEIAI